MLPVLNPFDDFESTAQIEPLRSRWIVGVNLQVESRGPPVREQRHGRSQQRLGEASAAQPFADA